MPSYGLGAELFLNLEINKSTQATAHWREVESAQVSAEIGIFVGVYVFHMRLAGCNKIIFSR